MQQKTTTKQTGSGGDGSNEIEITVGTTTGGKKTIKIKKGMTLSQLLKYKIAHQLKKGQIVTRNKHIVEHKDGELLEDPVLQENDLIVIQTEITGGKKV